MGPAVPDVPVSYDTDLDTATRVIKEAADSVRREQPEGATVLQEPEVWGVEDLGDSAVVIRMALKVEPGEQFAAARPARRRIKGALDAAAMEIPLPQQAGWLRSPGAGTDADRATAAAG